MGAGQNKLDRVGQIELVADEPARAGWGRTKLEVSHVRGSRITAFGQKMPAAI